MKKDYNHPSKIIKDIEGKEIKDAKVVFINMPLREIAVPTITPEGSLLLATILRQNYGVNASVIDLNVYRINDGLAKERGLENGRILTLGEAHRLMEKHFKTHGEPDLIGLSGIITTLRWQENIAKIIRKIFPDVFLVSGNGLATELKIGLFNYIPELDGVAHSEGDDVIVKIVYDAMLIKKRGFLKALQSGKLAPYYLGKINGKHRFFYQGGRPLDLDKIPFADLDLLKTDVNGNQPLEQYIRTAVWGPSANNSSATSFSIKRSTTFVSSRGCPYSCSFCYRGAQGERNYGLRSAANIAGEMKRHIKKYGVDFIGMLDDNFGVNYQRIKDLAPLLKPLKIRWGTHMRLDEAMGLESENPKRIDLMAEAGCIYVGFGAESASKSVLETMGKGGFILSRGLIEIKINGKPYQFPRAIIEGIRNCEHAGIHGNCTWIMGYPTETLEDLKMSVAFIKWQEDFYASFGKSASSVNKRMFTATWYPGTKMIFHPKVQATLAQVFDISFDPATKEPICDEKFHQYVLELDDATKVLHDSKTGQPLNYSDMPTDIFLRAREYIDSNQIFKILEM